MTDRFMPVGSYDGALVAVVAVWVESNDNEIIVDVAGCDCAAVMKRAEASRLRRLPPPLCPQNIGPVSSLKRVSD